MKKILFILFLLNSQYAAAQVAQTFLDTIGSSFLNSVIETSDGNFLTAGQENSNALIVKLNQRGDTIWTAFLVGLQDEAINSLAELHNHQGYIASGATNSLTPSLNNTNLMFGIDENGNVLWQKFYFTDTSQSLLVTNIKITTDDSILVAGSVIDSMNGWTGVLFKTDKLGNIGWSKFFYGGAMLPVKMILTPSEEILLVGSFATFVKLDRFGNVILSTQFGDSFEPNEDFNSITFDNDKNYFLTGYYSNVWSQTYYPFVCKLDSMGTLMWSKYFTNNYYSLSTEIFALSSNTFAITGCEPRMFVCQIDSSGSFLSTKYQNDTLGVHYSLGHTPSCLTSDKRLLICNRNIISLKDSIGIGCFTFDTLMNNGIAHLFPLSFGVSSAPFIINQDTSTLQFQRGVYFHKECEVILSLENIDNESALEIYPNPATNTFTLTNISSKEKARLQISNTLGEIVYSIMMFGKNEWVVHSSLSSGIYFVSVNDGERNVVKKLIIE